MESRGSDAADAVAEWLDLEAQGRVLLPKRYLQQIGASSSVLFVGMLDRMAVWDKAAYEQSRMSSAEFAKRLSAKMMKRPSVND